MDRQSTKLTPTRWKVNSCQFNQAQSNLISSKPLFTKEAHTQRTVNSNQKITLARMARNRAQLVLKMLEPQSQRRSQHQTRIKLFNLDKPVKNLTIALQNSHLQPKLDIHQRIPIKLTKIHSSCFLI